VVDEAAPIAGLAAVVLTTVNSPAPAEVFAEQPVCRLVVQRLDPAHCRVTTRDGDTMIARAARPDLVETAAAALLFWLDAGHRLETAITVQLGSQAVEPTVTRQDRP
jgi:hypothetical protein